MRVLRRLTLSWARTLPIDLAIDFLRGSNICFARQRVSLCALGQAAPVQGWGEGRLRPDCFANRYRTLARRGRVEVAFGAYTAVIATFPDDWIDLRLKTRVVREHIPSPVKKA
jgi:hypothetical protein